MAEATKKRPRRKREKTVQTRDREATRCALVDAGEHLFAQHGFKGVTLDMLSAASGANKALVSYYFGSKAGLYDAVIEALVSDVVSVVAGSVEEEGDPVKNFDRYIHALARAFAARPTFPAILMREYLSGGMQEREKPFREVLKFFRTTERLYKRGRRQKLFRTVDPHQLHLSIVGPLVHFVLTMGFRKRTFGRFVENVDDPTVDAFAAHLSGLLLGGLRRDETRRPRGGMV